MNTQNQSNNSIHSHPGAEREGAGTPFQKRRAQVPPGGAHFSEELNRQLTASGLTQVQLAKASGLSQSQISKWFRAEQTSVDEAQMTALAQALSQDPATQAALVAAHLQDEKFGPSSELVSISLQCPAPELPKTEGQAAIDFLSQLRLRNPAANDLIIALARCLRSNTEILPKM